jgi:hypothetical protein
MEKGALLDVLFSALPVCGLSHSRMGHSFHEKMGWMVDVYAGNFGENDSSGAVAR